MPPRDAQPRYSHPGLYALGMAIEDADFRADLTAEIKTSRRQPLTPQDVHVLRLRYGLVLDGAEITTDCGRERYEYVFFGPSRFVVGREPETRRGSAVEVTWGSVEVRVGGVLVGSAAPLGPPPPKTIWDHLLEDS